MNRERLKAEKVKAYTTAHRDRARLLRRAQTDAETKFWHAVKAGRLAGYKFRRQYPICQYIADFVCVDSKLIVEIDGGQHCENERDKMRTAFLESHGYEVLRFWNDAVLENIEGVLEARSLALSLRERGHSRKTKQI